MNSESKLIFEAYQSGKPASGAYFCYTAKTDSAEFPHNGKFTLTLKAHNLIDAIKEVCANAGKGIQGFPSIPISPDHFAVRSTSLMDIAVSQTDEHGDPLEVSAISNSLKQSDFESILELCWDDKV